MKAFAALIPLLSLACSSPTTPTPAPTPTREVVHIQYAVNIPDRNVANRLMADNPQGAEIAPATAQFQWNYTEWYHGCPNAWFGPEDTGQCVYANVGIVVAPAAAASKISFTKKDWPDSGLDPKVEYRWLAFFYYVPVR